jgi:peptide/nickel transport system permease protein
MIRGEAMRIADSDFVAQARVVGTSPWRIMYKHIFPNIVNSLIVIMTLQVGMMILAEASLSFIGIGITAPTASWGSIVNDGLANINNAWWISTFPGICIGLVVLSGNFLGDWVRDKLDPRLRQL